MRLRWIHREEVHLEVGFAFGIGAVGLSGLVAGNARLHAFIPPETRGPPGGPGAESKAVPAGRTEGRGRTADAPIDLSIVQRPAREVGGAGRHRGRRADLTGGWRSFGADLEFGPSELLNFNAELSGAFGVSRDLQIAVPQVHGFGQLELEVETAQCAHAGLALENLIAYRVGQLVAHFMVAGCLQIALGTVLQMTRPAFDMDGFAGFVEMAVVEHVPQTSVRRLTAIPASSIIIAGGQKGHVFAFACQQHGRGRGSQGQVSQTLGVADGAALAELKFHLRHGLPGLQVAGPGHQLLVVGQCIQTQLGGLHPAQIHLAPPLFFGRRFYLDLHHHMTQAVG